MPLFNSSKTYESQIITYFLSLSNRFFDFLLPAFNKGDSFLFSSSAKLPWQSLIIFLFIISLSISSGSQIQLTAFPTSYCGAECAANERQFGIPIFSLANILLLFLLTSFVRQQQALRGNFKLRNFELLLIVLLITAEISILTSSINIQASLVWSLKFLFGFGIYIVFSRLKLDKKLLQTILLAFLTIAIVNVSLAFLQAIRGTLIGLPFENIKATVITERFLSFGETGYFRVTGILSHPGRLSGYLAMLLPLSFVLTLHRNKIIKIIAFIATIGGPAVSILALSRWGLLVNLISFALSFLFIMKFSSQSLYATLKGAKLYFVVFLLLAIPIFTNGVMADRFLRFSPQEDSSFRGRMALISEAFFVIQENPLLGVGGGNFTLYLVNYDVTELNISERFPAPVHNFYLLTASEIGLGGLIIFLLVLASVISLFRKRIRYLPKNHRVIATAVAIACFIFFFHGLWSINSFENRTGFFFWLLLGLLVNILSLRRTPRFTHVYQ